MRAKILLIAENTRQHDGFRLAQNALSELAIAFSHSFSIREFIPASPEDWQNLANLCDQQNAVVLYGGAGFLTKAAQQLACHTGSVSTFKLASENDLCRLKAGPLPETAIFWPLGDSAASLGKAAVTACAHAKKRKQSLAYIAQPENADWHKAIIRAAMYAALPTPRELSLDAYFQDAMAKPADMPLLMSNDREAAFAAMMLHFFNGTELMKCMTFHADTRQYQAVEVSETPQFFPLFSALMALQATVGTSLGLEQEGDCLFSAIDNVLASGWRTPEFGIAEKTISQEEVMDLINRQIQLAGELLERLRS